ncbi:MAG: BtpA/SgcQ family protein [Candidatus Limnocylindria bacterium]
MGMIHLAPLPGAANDEGLSTDELVRRAVNDATILAEEGYDAILLQNANDHPPTARIGPAALAAYACVAREVRAACTLPIGISVLKQDVGASFAIARASAAAFIRLKGYVGVEVGPEGLLEGCAADAVRERRVLGLDDVEIWADAIQPTSRPMGSVSVTDLARWCVEFGEADRVIVTADDVAASMELLPTLRSAIDHPLILGGGATPDDIGRATVEWDGVIVGRYLRGGGLGSPIDRRLAAQIRSAAASKRDPA